MQGVRMQDAEMHEKGNAEVQQVVIFDLANCQERDYRLRIRIGWFEVTLRDEELCSSATGC